VDETVRRNLDELSHEAQARAHKLREALRSDDTRRRNALAVTLIVIGALLLAGHAGGLLFVSWVVVVPLLLIALGVAVLLGVFQRRIP
jgi:fatty acid desaturase